MPDRIRLDGRVAVVTGAAGVIGTATIRLLAERGARIVAVDRREPDLAAAIKDLPASAEALAVTADVTSEVVVAAIRAARPVRAMVRSISRLLQANRARDIVQTYPPLASHPVNTANTARKGRLAPFPPHSTVARKVGNRLSIVAP